MGPTSATPVSFAGARPQAFGFAPCRVEALGAAIGGMSLQEFARSRIKAGRKRGAGWVRLLDVARLLVSGEGRGVLWTRIRKGDEVHQTTPHTAEERYPELFGLAARLAPNAARILSFGCSTGEELVSIRRRFPEAEIVGAEINSRSRRLARKRLAHDPGAVILAPDALVGSFDLIFALSVFQREPHKIAEMGVQHLSLHYPFQRFDAAVSRLVEQLRPGGLLCVINAQYRVEDSSIAETLEPVPDAPLMDPPLFAPDGRRLEAPEARTIFRMVERKP